MRICVFGDVHGNAAALRRVMAEMAGEDPDLTVCTGDTVFGWGEPDECVDAVRRLGCPWVTGNADQTVLETEGFRQSGDSPAGRCVAWNRQRLGAERLRLLAALPAGIALHFRDAGAVRVAHGCPPDRITPGVRPAGRRDWDGDFGDDEAVQRWLGPEPPGVFLCGHTHVPTIRRIGATLIVNPGSAGYGIHKDAPARYQTGNAVARYAVVTWAGGEGWSAAIRRVPYKAGAALDGIEGLPWAGPAEVARRRAFLERPAVGGDRDPVGDEG